MQNEHHQTGSQSQQHHLHPLLLSTWHANWASICIPITSKCHFTLHSPSHLTSKLGIKLRLVINDVHVACGVVKLDVDVREVWRDARMQAFFGVCGDHGFCVVLAPLRLCLLWGMCV